MNSINLMKTYSLSSLFFLKSPEIAFSHPVRGIQIIRALVKTIAAVVKAMLMAPLPVEAPPVSPPVAGAAPLSASSSSFCALGSQLVNVSSELH